MALSQRALCTVEQVEAELKLTDKQPDPAAIEAAIEAASAAICRYAKRELWAADTVASERLFPTAQVLPYEDLYALTIGDAAEVVDVSDDYGTALFVAVPVNRDPALEPVLGLTFAAETSGVITVTARWGWPQVDPAVNEAAVKQASAWFGQDSTRLADSWADELRGAGIQRTSGQEGRPRGLTLQVRDLISPFRYVSVA
jgi:hypothetical protein